MRYAIGLVAAAFATLVALACSSDSGVEGETLCEPGKEYYCRCKNLDEGSQLCRADGQGYERCEPCYADDDDDDDGPYGFPEEDDAGDDAGARCGNGTVDPGESCDDGNSDADDGCDRCVAGGDPLTGTACPGITVHLWDAPFELSGSTSRAGDAHTGLECDGVTGGEAADRVYTLIPHRTGPLRIDLRDADFDAVLYVRSDCEDVFTQSACSRDGRPITVEVSEPETPVVVTVDAPRGDSGSYTLRFQAAAD